MAATTEGTRLRLAVSLAMRHMEPGQPIELRLACLGKPHRSIWKHLSETVRREQRNHPYCVFRTSQVGRGTCAFNLERTV